MGLQNEDDRVNSDSEEKISELCQEMHPQLRPAKWRSATSLMAQISPVGVRSPGRMFSLQQSLPHLPVPPLQQTLDKFLLQLEPLVSKEEMQQARELVQNFANKDGPVLQAILEKRGQEKLNWLTDWWFKVAYMECRLPVPIHMNPGGIFPLQKFNGRASQLRYAAKLTSGILDYKVMIDQRSLPVEMLGDSPLCMKQFYQILSACRIPGTKRDSLVHYPPDMENPPRNIVVAHNNHFFSLDVYGSNNKPLSTNQLHTQLVKIVEASQTPAPPVGILTSDGRNAWGLAYEKLNKSDMNRKSMGEIHRAIFMLCLDEPMKFEHDTPTDRQSLIAGQMNHGWGAKRNSGNRWFDKTMQFIVGIDGAVGMNYEHAPAEGPPIISIADHAINYLKFEHTQEDAPGMKDPVNLPFELNPEIEKAMDEATERLEATIADLDMTLYCFDAFGKNFAKAQRLSPDAFIQVAFQLAYFRLYGKFVASYESGSLRRFQEGRTDNIRGNTREAAAYCRSMTDPSKSVEERGRLLRQAVKAHRAYTNDVLAGNGIDRHLLGLKLTAIENGMNVPDLHMDPLYELSNYFVISTSQVPSKHDAVLCFGPAVPNGYGICYNPMPDRINMVVSAWNSSPETDARKMAGEIRKALMDGHNVLLQTQQAKL